MRIYLGLGTNLGDKELNLRVAVQKIEERIGKVISLSAFYATAPWGFQSDNNFLNAAAGVETSLSPFDILERTQQIEQEIGRLHKSHDGVYSDRLIDIDLLLYGDKILQDERLSLPHPLPSHSGSLPAALVWKGTFYPEIFPVSVLYIRYIR